ncbi:MAG: molybdenum cofactor guanylyltransferase [Candidatus Bathyarchaeota archaeon]|nr:molybdenum cofactor guanylyltransferase [Candidatus Bathyarchaeota archaeon]
MRSAVVLAGGKSSRMGGDKGLITLEGKPIIAHVLERLRPVVDEVVIVVGSDAQGEAYGSFGARVVADRLPSGSPLVGAYTGLGEARGEYTFLTGGDQPLIDPRVVELLFAEAEGHDAATPYWPNGWVEPLHSVYRSRKAADAALVLIESGEKRLRFMLDALPDVKRVPIDEVKAIDPELRTLMDVDTAEDLERVRRLI